MKAIFKNKIVALKRNCATAKFLMMAVALAAAVSAALLIYFNNPVKTAWMPKCPSYLLTGLHCPGCGATRAFYALLHGNVIAALRCNVLLFPMLATAIALWIRPDWARKKYVGITVASVIILFAILRNLPFYPFNLLAPLNN